MQMPMSPPLAGAFWLAACANPSLGLPVMQSHVYIARAGADVCPLPNCTAGPGSQSLQCEPQGSSFVTGFSQAVRVASTLNAFYPIGNVDCCTPSVLLSSGEPAHVVASSQHAGYPSAEQFLQPPVLVSPGGPLPYHRLPHHV